MEQQTLNDIILNLVSEMELKAYAGSYVHSIIKVLKSWLAFKQRSITAGVKISGVQETPTLRNEKSPSREELRAIFRSGDKRARVAMVLMAHSGVRPGTLGYFGKDGLTIGDLVGMTIQDEHVNFVKKPAMIVVRSTISKAGHQYFTFLSEEGCEYLKEYIEERVRLREKLTGNSPLMAQEWGRGKPRFVTTKVISKSIRDSLRKAGFAWRPYVLRTYFDTQLLLAESKGAIVRDYRTFFMGHKGDIENRYTTNRQKLPECLRQYDWKWQV